jgi:NitT/TauT family transport system substrate-binding protein
MRVRVSGLLLAVLCGSGAAAEPFRIITTDLTAQLVPNSVIDLAAELGYFTREGVEVELVRVEQTPLAAAALQAGEGEMANISVDAALQMVARDVMDLKAVVSPNKSLPFLIAARDGIASPADLAGRSFAVGRIGSLDHSLSTAVLRSKGVSPEALEIVAIGQPSARAQALAAGQVDATTMSIGVWLSIPDRTGLSVLIDQDTYYAAAPVVNKVNVVPDAVLAERGAEVDAVVRALIAVSRDVSADPSIWVETMTKLRPDVSRDTLETLATAFAGSWSINGGLNRAELELTQAWMYEGPDFADLPRIALADWVDLGPITRYLDASGIATPYDVPGL